ncbi:unnamed protein product, partial [Tenebrio molitor]
NINIFTFCLCKYEEREKMDSHILKTHSDSTIECRQLSEEFLEETLSLMEKVYFAEEKIVGAF